jgi:hypothetical protein
MTKRKPAKPKGKAKTARKATKPKPAPAVIMKSAEGIVYEEINEPLKLTVKQETFCQGYIETGNASEAYRRAYGCSNWTDKSIWEKASHLLANVKVKARVNELKAMHQERHQITVDDLVAELEEARAIAKKNEVPASMVAATMGKGKLLGLVVDKNEHTGKDGEKLVPANTNSRDLARAVLDILREAQIEGAAELDDELVDVEIDVSNPLPRIRTFNPATGRLEFTDALMCASQMARSPAAPLA